MTTTDHSPLRRGEAGGWAVIESEPGRVQARVLMLPGLFCTSAFFTDVLEIGLTEEERATLEAAQNVTLKAIPGAAHFSITDAPHAVAQLVVDLLGTRA